MDRLNLPVIIIILLILTIIVGAIFTWPKYQELKVLKAAVGEKRAELQDQEDYIKDLLSTAEELKKYEDSLLKISSALPGAPSLPGLLDFFQKASSQSGLILKGMGSILVVPHKTITEIRETKISLTLSGNYPSFKNFLLTVEKSARMIEVENISFSTSRGEGPTEFNLRVKAPSY